MKYTVHLYKAVRITMEGIEAESQEEAARVADEQCDVAEALRIGAAELPSLSTCRWRASK